MNQENFKDLVQMRILSRGQKISKAERNYRIKYTVLISLAFVFVLTFLWILLNNKIVNMYIFIFGGLALAIIAGIVAAMVSGKAASRFRQGKQ